MNNKHVEFIHSLCEKTFENKVTWSNIDFLPNKLLSIFTTVDDMNCFSCQIDCGYIFFINGAKHYNGILSPSVFLNNNDKFVELNVPMPDRYQLLNSIHSNIASVDTLVDLFSNELNNS